jgi:hypothetical protein
MSCNIKIAPTTKSYLGKGDDAKKNERREVMM